MNDSEPHIFTQTIERPLEMLHRRANGVPAAQFLRDPSAILRGNGGRGQTPRGGINQKHDSNAAQTGLGGVLEFERRDAVLEQKVRKRQQSALERVHISVFLLQRFAIADSVDVFRAVEVSLRDQRLRDPSSETEVALSNIFRPQIRNSWAQAVLTKKKLEEATRRGGWWGRRRQ
jgi:hypothetical protein